MCLIPSECDAAALQVWCGTMVHPDCAANSCRFPFSGHGTHCVGVIGAAGDNQVGISGAAWNVKIYPCKVFPHKGEGE